MEAVIFWTFVAITVVYTVVRLINDIVGEHNNESDDTNRPNETDLNNLINKVKASTEKVYEGEYLAFEEQPKTTTTSQRENNKVSVYERNKSNSPLTDHTAEVWERMGYQVKYGEQPSYKYYGKEIYTPNQVEKCNFPVKQRSLDYYKQKVYRSYLSEKQIEIKALGLMLVEQTSSKRQAKDILVNEYGFRENTAKYAVGYDGYRDW